MVRAIHFPSTFDMKTIAIRGQYTPDVMSDDSPSSRADEGKRTCPRQYHFIPRQLQVVKQG